MCWVRAATSESSCGSALSWYSRHGHTERKRRRSQAHALTFALSERPSPERRAGAEPVLAPSDSVTPKRSSISVISSTSTLQDKFN